MFKIVDCSVIDFISKESRDAELLDPSILARIYAKFFKIQTFFVEKMTFFGPLALTLLEVDTFKLRPYSS